jgi:Flp pilus assembly protein TadB
VFGRRTSAQEPADSEQLSKTEGKGRATPTRKEAEEARKQRLAAPRGRRSTAAQSRQRAREQRLKQGEALRTGDERYLPARDRGPVKKFARDYVDSRHTIGEYLLLVFVAAFLIALVVPGAYLVASWAWFALLLLMAADSIRIVRGLKAKVRERFGDDKTKGIALYAVMRSWQMRRLRLPKPQVKAGDAI